MRKIKAEEDPFDGKWSNSFLINGFNFKFFEFHLVKGMSKTF